MIVRLVQGQVEDPHLAQLSRREAESVYGRMISDLRQIPARRSTLGRMADLTRRSHDLRVGVAAYVADRQRAGIAELRELDAGDAAGNVVRLSGWDPAAGR